MHLSEDYEYMENQAAALHVDLLQETGFSALICFHSF